MRITFKKDAEGFFGIEKWHRWFAWHPIWCDNTFVWLEHVQRKCHYNGYEGSWDSEYKIEEAKS